MNQAWHDAADRLLKRYRVDRAALPSYVLGLANIAILFSIAVSQILLGLGLLLLFFGYRRGKGGESPRPGIEAPFPAAILGLYFLWTVVSLLASPAPALCLPQIKKFFIFLILPAGYTAFRRIQGAHRVIDWTFIACGLAGLLSLLEFGVFYRALSSAKDFYSSYSKARITGFMSHWQTFSGEQMMVLVMLLALLLYSRRRPWWTWACAASIALSLLFSLTRGAWVGFMAAAVCLFWPLGRRWILALPLALLLFFLAAPPFFRDRIESFTNLRSDSSNQARVLMLRTGQRMIAAHPLTGVGPNMVQYTFGAFRPAGPVPEGWYGHLHNDYVQIAAERGLPALAIFVWFLAAVLRDQRRLLGRLPAERQYIARGVAAVVVGFAVAGLFEYNFGDSEVAMLLLFFIAHGYAAGEQAVLRADSAAPAV